MQLEFSQQIFENSSNIKFHENPSIESRVRPCGETDGPAETGRPDEDNNRFSQFCERA
jgi:hypothetical protein